MTAISASFPIYYASEAAYQAAVPTPVLPEGMRELSTLELNYISGGLFGIKINFGKLFESAWDGMAVLFATMALGPFGGAAVGFVTRYITFT